MIQTQQPLLFNSSGPLFGRAIFGAPALSGLVRQSSELSVGGDSFFNLNSAFGFPYPLEVPGASIQWPGVPGFPSDLMPTPTLPGFPETTDFTETRIFKVWKDSGLLFVGLLILSIGLLGFVWPYAKGPVKSAVDVAL